MKIGMWATNYDSEFMPLLTLQLDKAKIPYDVSVGEKWVPGKAWEVRLAWYHKWLTRQSGQVMLLDPWDNVFLGTRGALMDRVDEFENNIIWAAEKALWPQKERAGFPDTGTPYRYPNGGGIVGDAEFLAYLFDPSLIEGFGKPNYDQEGVYHPDGNQPWLDQPFFQDLYLDGVGRLDAKCRIFQTLVGHSQNDFALEGSQVRNVITNECPLFFHANGKARMPDAVMNAIKLTL